MTNGIIVPLANASRMKSTNVRFANVLLERRPVIRVRNSRLLIELIAASSERYLEASVLFCERLAIFFELRQRRIAQKLRRLGSNSPEYADVFQCWSRLAISVPSINATVSARSPRRRRDTRRSSGSDSRKRLRDGELHHRWENFRSQFLTDRAGSVDLIQWNRWSARFF